MNVGSTFNDSIQAELSSFLVQQMQEMDHGVHFSYFRILATPNIQQVSAQMMCQEQTAIAPKPITNISVLAAYVSACMNIMVRRQ